MWKRASAGSNSRAYRHRSGVDSPYILGRSLDLFVDASIRSETAATAPVVVLRTENTARAGLGEPLPAGPVRVFETGDHGSIFVGQSGLRDRPVGAEIELELGQALDLLVTSDFRVEEGSRVELAADHRVINDKSQAIDLEVLHLISGAADLAVEESSRPYELTGDSVSWRFDVPPGAEPLFYRLSESNR